MDRRSMLRGGRRSPGPSGKAFSPEDLFMKRLYMTNADNNIYLINSTTRSSQTQDTTPLTITLNSETDVHTSVSVDGITGGVSNPRRFYNSAGCSWKIFDIFGNPVYGNSPVILQWCTVLTERKATGGNYPPTSGTNPRSWIALGVSGYQADAIETGHTLPAVGCYIKNAADGDRMVFGCHSANNFTILSGVGGQKFFVGTMMLGPKKDTTDCFLSPLIAGHYSTDAAGTNTESGQAIEEAKFDQIDPNNTPTFPEGNQLHWLFGLGRSGQGGTDDTVCEGRFRLYARAIQLAPVSDNCPDIRLLGQTW